MAALKIPTRHFALSSRDLQQRFIKAGQQRGKSPVRLNLTNQRAPEVNRAVLDLQHLSG
jgi:hypothetical protein